MSTELNPRNLTVTALHPPPEVLDGADEVQLVARAKNGCTAAFEQLIGRYESRVFRLARNITGNDEDSEEVIQNAFFNAFQNLAEFRGKSRFYTWLVRIAVNEALMKIRTRPLLKEVSIDDVKDSQAGEVLTVSREPRDWGPSPEQRFSQRELHRILDTAINNLASRYRIVFHLRDIEKFSLKETAQTLRLTPSAVKSRSRRARLQLRDSLHPYFRPMSGKQKSQALVVGDVRSWSMLAGLA